VSALREIKTFLTPQGVAHVQTALQPSDIETIRANWWYVAPRNGHVSIFSLQALCAAAGASGLQLLVDQDQRTWFAHHDTRDLQLEPFEFKTVSCLTLQAPAEDQAGWHGIEWAGDRPFRWTASEKLSWQVSLPERPCVLMIRIPVVQSIDPQFLDGCTAEIDGRRILLQREGEFLQGQFDLPARFPGPSPRRLDVATRPPLRPCDLKDTPDSRPLGVAVEVAIGRPRLAQAHGGS
jgi:hypothetical protein